MKKAAVVTWGRLNPPTSGHQKVIDKVKTLAKKQGAMPHVYLSHSHDSNKNPLDYNTKIKFAKKAFGPSVTKSKSRTIIEVLKELQNMGHTEVTLLVGSDRIREFKSLTSRYNGKDFTFNKIDVVSAGARDPDAENVSGMSATKMRAAAKLGDYKTFKRGTPSTMSERDKKDMYDKIRSVVEHVSEEDFEDKDFEFTDEELDIFIDAIDLDSLEEEINEEIEKELELIEWKKPLSVAQRIKIGRRMKRLAPRMKRKRQIQRKRMADLPRLQRRSRKAALRIIRKRFAGKQGQNYTKLSPSAKLSVDRIIQRHLPRVAKLSTRLLPRIRKAEVQRLQRARGGSTPVRKDKAPMMASYTVDDQFKNYLKENEESIIIFEKEEEDDDTNTRLMVMLRQAFRDPKERMLVIRALKGGAKSLQNPKLRPFILKLLNRLLDATQSDTSMFSKMKDRLRRMGQEDDKEKKKDTNESFKIYMSLYDKADKANIPLDIILEVYNREEDSNKGFDRVNSYIAGGAAKELDNDLVVAWESQFPLMESYENRVIELLKKKMIDAHFKNGKLHVDKTDMKAARMIISKEPMIQKIPSVIGEAKVTIRKEDGEYAVYVDRKMHSSYARKIVATNVANKLKKGKMKEEVELDEYERKPNKLGQDKAFDRRFGTVKITLKAKNGDTKTVHWRPTEVANKLSTARKRGWEVKRKTNEDVELDEAGYLSFSRPGPLKDKFGKGAKSPQDMTDSELKNWLKRPANKGPGSATWRKLIRQEMKSRGLREEVELDEAGYLSFSRPGPLKDKFGQKSSEKMNSFAVSYQTKSGKTGSIKIDARDQKEAKMKARRKLAGKFSAINSAQLTKEDVEGANRKTKIKISDRDRDAAAALKQKREMDKGSSPPKSDFIKVYNIKTGYVQSAPKSGYDTKKFKPAPKGKNTGDYMPGFKKEEVELDEISPVKEDAIDRANARITRQKKASAQRHDAIMDRARLKKARNKVRKARRINQRTESININFEKYLAEKSF